MSSYRRLGVGSKTGLWGLGLVLVLALVLGRVEAQTEGLPSPGPDSSLSPGPGPSLEPDLFRDKNLQEVQEEEVSDQSPVSPLSSWLIFRRNSSKDQRKSKSQRKTRTKHGPPGPPGPPGPEGPIGPSAPPLPQQQELLQQFRGRLRVLAEEACLQCEAPPRVSVWFLTRLQVQALVPRRTLLELQAFSQAHSSSARAVSLVSGRFVAPVSGFYQLTSSLFVESGDRVQVRVRDHVRAAICIQSLCKTNLSVAAVMGVATAGGTFSILLTGTLHLQEGEYVSVFVDNGTGSSITVLPHSLFSGVLLGV